jgi:hypothetical protein
MEDFRLMVNDCIRIGLEERDGRDGGEIITSMRKLSLCVLSSSARSVRPPHVLSTHRHLKGCGHLEKLPQSEEEKEESRDAEAPIR